MSDKYNWFTVWPAGPAPRALMWAIGLALAIFAMLGLINSHARAAASLNVEIIAGYNLVVDSNVTSPSTYAPRVATVIGKFCNPGTTDLTDVYGYIGNGTTPGTYPARNSLTDAEFQSGQKWNYLYNTGSYAFRHVGPVADASRYIGTIPAGRCVYQYWTIEYPACENVLDGGTWKWKEPPCTGDPLWGNSVKPEDDLSLQFVIWGRGKDGSTPRSGSATWTMTMRNEISAAANKIEPNGNPPGRWFNTTSPVRVGDVITTNGVLYSLGNVRFGFDNDGDYAPDYNAWLQPISQADYDPTCFRLIRTSGMLTVTRGGGNPTMFINFKDTLYFTNIPADNTNVRGEVYYTFLALNGPCSVNLSPYQEVASGFDNEKFNDDLGTGLPPLESLAPDVIISKVSAPSTIAVGDTTTYTIPLANTGDRPAGLSMSMYGINMPLVISDTVPHGMQLAYTATYNLNFAPNSGVTIRYSTDSGQTWSATAPVGSTSTWPNNKIIIQWWLNDPLPAGSTGNWVRFRATVPAGYSGVPFIENTACVGLGDARPFACDNDIIMIRGNGAIGDFVWRDENNDGLQTGETANGINGVAVSLYWDRNGNGQPDSGDLLMFTQDTYTYSGNPGYYQFTELPAAKYLVVVDKTDPQIPTGYRLTTPGFYAVTLAGGQSYQTADFGFGPSLSIEKRMVSAGGTCDAYEGQEVVYNIALINKRPGTGETVAGGCRYSVWATTGSTANTPKNFTNYTAAFGEPDNVYASGDFSVGSNRWIKGTGFNAGGSGTISSVEAVFRIYVNPALSNDYATARLYQGASQLGFVNFTTAQINTFTGQGNAGYLTWNLSGITPPGGSWTWDDFALLTLHLEPQKDGGADPSTLYIDAIGFRVIAGGACPVLDSNNIMTTVPLTDTYNTTYLQFVSADPPHSAINTTAGVITWTNVGPIYPGESRVVTVRFLAKAISGTSSQTVNNSAGSTGTRFADGGYANNVYKTASGTICQTGSINGYVYSDPNSSGWNYNPGAGDLPIPGVRVTLYGCYDKTTDELIISPKNDNKPCTDSQNNGEWRVVSTQPTNAGGYYEFNGLFYGFYYVQVTGADIPGTKTQTAEANDNQSATGTLPNTTANGHTCGQPGGTCDSIWGNPTANLNTTNFNPINSSGETINGVNFGYNIQAGVYGSVWEDNNGNGSKNSGEGPIGSVTVRIRTGSCSGTVIGSATTDSNGRYQYGGLTAGTTYYITVDTGTLPGGSSAWTQTGESDGSVNNCIQFTAVAGTLSGSHDFGFRKTGSYMLGDTLYYDWNGDGTQQSNEEGIPNVTVYLYEDVNGNGIIDPEDAFIASTSTNSSGYYQFVNLPAGSYLVIVDTNDPDFPAGVVETQDPDESGVCTICNSRGRRTITTSSYDNVDFGYQPRGKGAIGDTVWRDMNGDGVQAGPTETGIAGITVWLEVDLNNDGTYSRVATAVTDSGGKYLFSNLPDGKYRVVVDTSDSDLPTAPGGFTYVPSTPTTYHRTLNDTQRVYLDADFGFTPLAVIGDFVYYDANASGSQEWNETGIPTVTVQLINSSGFSIVYNGVTYPNGAVIAAAVTAYNPTNNPAYPPTGWYQFAGLPSGGPNSPYTYTVRVVTTTLPSGVVQTADPDRDGVPCNVNDPNVSACDHQTTVRVFPGTVFLGADFGYKPTGAIGNYVWIDANRNGVQDAGEAPIAGVVVRVTNGAVTYTTTTDLDGNYTFQGLGSGAWTVYLNIPTSMTPTLYTITPTAVISGVGNVGILSGTTQVSATVVIGSNGAAQSINGVSCVSGKDCSLNVDFGFYYSGLRTISGHVFFDAGGTDDGQDDLYNSGTDTPYGGITVYLWKDGKIIGQTTTNATGAYTFTNVPAASGYTVSVDRAGLLSLMDITASPNTGKSYVSVDTTAGNVGDRDFGFYANMDMGDLPEEYNQNNNRVDAQFSTLFAHEGPIHINRSGAYSPTIYLGQVWDGEADGHPHWDAGKAGTNGDDGANRDDEDGIEFLDDWYQGATVRLRITITDRDDKYTPYLVGWFDWNQNGRFGAGETIDLGEFGAGRPGGRTTLGPYTHRYTVTITIPSNASRVMIYDTNNQNGDYRIYMRFRLYATQSPPPVISPIGVVDNGEVEDYWQRNNGPLAVTLASFTAAPEGQAIRLNWETAGELNNIGFNLYRSLSPQGPWTRLNGNVIAAANPGSVMGASYTYLDETVKPGLTYYYLLEDIDRETGVTQHGPVWATPGADPRPFKLYLPAVFRP